MSGFASYLAWFWTNESDPPDNTHHVTQQMLSRQIGLLRSTRTRPTVTHFRHNDNSVISELHHFFVQHELGPEHEFALLDDDSISCDVNHGPKYDNSSELPSLTTQHQPSNHTAQFCNIELSPPRSADQPQPTKEV